MDVTIRAITADNYMHVSDLELPNAQQNMLAHNDFSMLQSHYIDACNARAIYLYDEVVGFIMWVYSQKKLASIWRFMIDHEHQKKGIGTKALECALLEIKTMPGIEKIFISYAPNNEVARKMYANVGFRELETEEGDEDNVAVMNL